jgi:hypothetical protein
MTGLLREGYEEGYVKGYVDSLSDGAKIKGWIARSQQGQLYIYTCKPYWNDFDERWDGPIITSIDGSLYPDITIDTEPKRVSLNLVFEE